MDTKHKHCVRCDQTKAVSEYNNNIGRADGLTVYCTVCSRAATNESKARRRKAAIEALGGRCVRCGYTADWRALQFDHVNDDGKLQRASGNGLNKIIKVILRGEIPGAEIQLLCANCNAIKMWESSIWKGKRVYGRGVVPTERIVPANWSHTPESNAARSRTMKAHRAEQRAWS